MNAILDERPTQLEVHGAELLTVSAELRRRGCVILGAVTKRPGSYKLSLSWPRPEQMPLPQILPRLASTVKPRRALIARPLS